MDFDYSVRLILWLPRRVIIECRVAGLPRHVRCKPLDTRQVEHALPVEVVYGEFYLIPLTDLCNRLDVSPAHDYLPERPLQHIWVAQGFLVFVNPDYAGLMLWDDVQFEVGCMFLSASRYLAQICVLHRYLWLGLNTTPFLTGLLFKRRIISQHFIRITYPETLIQMLFIREHFAFNYPIDSDWRPTTWQNHWGIRVWRFEQ